MVALLMVRKFEQQSRYRKPETAEMVDAMTLESFRRWSHLSQKYHWYLICHGVFFKDSLEGALVVVTC